ncbi:50S ribosomal protein L3 [Streptomyces echinatus]
MGRDNRVVPVTVVKAGPNVVTQVRTNDVDGYESRRQIAFGEISTRARVNSPSGHTSPRPHVTPRRTSSETPYQLTPASTPLGQEITAEVFEAASGRRDRQEQGQGLRRCHEASTTSRASAHDTAPSARHRSPGSIGGCATRAACFKASAMAGRMGNERVTTQNLTVHAR